MSIKTSTQGDMSVTRNANIGGRVTARGSGTFGGNLRIKGWLFAANIHDVNKGIFVDVETLRSVYPNPEEGWVAGVGASTPFDTYLGHNGAWVATGGTVDFVGDLSRYDEALEELYSDVDNALATLEEKVDKSQGVDNAGRVMEVGADGIMKPGKKNVVMSEEEYAALDTYDADTLYYIYEDEEPKPGTAESIDITTHILNLTAIDGNTGKSQGLMNSNTLNL